MSAASRAHARGHYEVPRPTLEKNRLSLPPRALLKNKKGVPTQFIDFGLTGCVEFPLLALRAPIKRTLASHPL